jgi:hypothetical protein
MITADEAEIALKVLKETVAELRTDYGKRMLGTSPEDTKGREFLYAQSRALNEVEQALQRPINAAKVSRSRG